MTVEETIIAFSGTAVGGAIIGKWLNRKKDDLESQLKEQVFYKSLIADITEQRKIEQHEIVELKNKVEKLTAKVNELIEGHKVKDEIIDNQKRTIAQYESMVQRLENISDSDRKKLNKLISFIEKNGLKVD